MELDYAYGLNKRLNSKFCETPEEGQRTHWLKREYNNKDENNSLNTLNDKNNQASSKIFRLIYGFLKICFGTLITSYKLEIECFKTPVLFHLITYMPW